MTHFFIASVIAIAAAGAIIGDNLGYSVIGRVAGEHRPAKRRGPTGRRAAAR